MRMACVVEKKEANILVFLHSSFLFLVNSSVLAQINFLGNLYWECDWRLC